MADYVERSVVRCNGVDLDDIIISITETSSRPTTPVNTMNKARVPRGFKQGNNVYRLEFEAERIDDPRVPDWHTIKDQGLRIAISVVPNVGKMVSYGGVAIETVTDATSDGNSTRRVTALARTRK